MPQLRGNEPILGLNRVGQGGLGEDAATSSKDCKCLFKVLINIFGLFPSSMCLHVLVYVCCNISQIDLFCLIHQSRRQLFVSYDPLQVLFGTCVLEQHGKKSKVRYIILSLLSFSMDNLNLQEWQFPKVVFCLGRVVCTPMENSPVRRGVIL